jgi:hypothetical protein
MDAHAWLSGVSIIHPWWYLGVSTICVISFLTCNYTVTCLNPRLSGVLTGGGETRAFSSLDAPSVGSIVAGVNVKDA